MRKDCLARELTTEIIVGAFILTVLFALGYFTIIMSRETWFAQKFEIAIMFDDVMGLGEGDNVIVRGMPVGKVKVLDLKPEGVHVVALLDDPVRMREGYDITIISTSILGGRNLVIYEGPDDAEELELDIYRGRKPSDLMTDAAEIVGTLRQELVESGAIAGFAETLHDLRKVVERVQGGEGTVGKLLSADDTLYNDLAATVASLKKLTERLEGGEGVLGKLMSPEADALYNDMAEAMASLKVVSGRIEAGEGTIGLLMTDDALYNDLRDAVNEARQAVDDFRETAPITTFSSIFFGAF